MWLCGQNCNCLVKIVTFWPTLGLTGGIKVKEKFRLNNIWPLSSFPVTTNFYFFGVNLSFNYITDFIFQTFSIQNHVQVQPSRKFCALKFQFRNSLWNFSLVTVFEKEKQDNWVASDWRSGEQAKAIQSSPNTLRRKTKVKYHKKLLLSPNNEKAKDKSSFYFVTSSLEINV